MKNKGNDAIVGLVVLLVVAALIVSLTWVQQTDLGDRRNSSVARVRDVGNARVGNAVVIRGVVAGRVQAIELAPEGWVLVRMKLDNAVEMPSDPVVLLSESSLFGEWQAAIVERSALPNDARIRRQVEEAGTARGVMPGASLPGIGELTAVAGQIAGNVATVAGRIEVAFDERAAKELRASIKNFSDLSATLKNTVKLHASDLDTMSSQLRTAVSSLTKTTSTVQQMAERVASSTDSGDIKRIVENVGQAAIEMRKTTAQIRDLTEKLGKSQGRLDTFLANGDSILVKVNGGQGSLGLLVNDPSLYRRTDSLMVGLMALVTDIKANPGRYVRIKIF